MTLWPPRLCGSVRTSSSPTSSPPCTSAPLREIFSYYILPSQHNISGIKNLSPGKVFIKKESFQRERLKIRIYPRQSADHFPISILQKVYRINVNFQVYAFVFSLLVTG